MSRRNRTDSPGIPDVDALVSRIEASSARETSLVVTALLVSVVGGRLALTVANNSPWSLPPDLVAVQDLLATAGPTVIGLLVVVLAIVHRDRLVRAGLAFAGVFGLLGLHVSVAALPAVVGVVAGLLLVVIGTGHGATSARTVAVGATLWIGLAASLSSATGLVDGSLRPVGSLVVLIGVAALPLARQPGLGGWIAGGATAYVVVWMGTAVPFVSGAVVLVAFGTVGAPLLALAVAAGGGVAGLAGAASDGQWSGALGIGLLLLAGVPATFPDALAAGTGLAVLLGGEQP